MVQTNLDRLEDGTLSVSQLRFLLDRIGVDHSLCIEKKELARKIKFVLFSNSYQAKTVLQDFRHRRVRSKLAHMAWVRSSPFTCGPSGVSLIPVQGWYPVSSTYFYGFLCKLC